MAYGVLLKVDGVEVVIEDEVLDVLDVLDTDINDFILLADTSTVQIFFADGIPSDPVVLAENGEIFMSPADRAFVSFNERVFRS